MLSADVPEVGCVRAVFDHLAALSPGLTVRTLGAAGAEEPVVGVRVCPSAAFSAWLAIAARGRLAARQGGRVVCALAYAVDTVRLVVGDGGRGPVLWLSVPVRCVTPLMGSAARSARWGCAGRHEGRAR